MSVSNIQVGGIGQPNFGEQTNSVRLLTGALDKVSERKDKRIIMAKQAAGDNVNLLNKQITNDILKEGPQDLFKQDASDEQQAAIGRRYNEEYDSLFDAAGKRRLVDPKDKNSDAAGLLARQEAFEQGKYGVLPGQEASAGMQNITDNLGMVREGGKSYSDRKYKELLSAGIDSDVATKERKNILSNMGATGDMSKADLAAAKIQARANNNQAKLESEMISKNNKISQQVTESIGGRNSSYRNGKYNKKGKGGGSIKAFANDKNIDFNSSNEGLTSIFSFGVDAQAVEKKLTQLKLKYDLPEWALADAARATTTGKANKWLKEDPNLTADEKLVKLAQTLVDENDSYSSGSNGNGNKTSQSTNTTRYLPGTGSAIQRIFQTAAEKNAALFNTGSDGQADKALFGNKQINDVFDGAYQGKTILDTAKPNVAPKIITDKPGEIPANEELLKMPIEENLKVRGYDKQTSDDLKWLAEAEGREDASKVLEDRERDSNSNNESSFLDRTLNWMNSFNMSPRGAAIGSETDLTYNPDSGLANAVNKLGPLNTTTQVNQAVSKIKKQFPGATKEQILQLIKTGDKNILR